MFFHHQTYYKNSNFNLVALQIFVRKVTILYQIPNFHVFLFLRLFNELYVWGNITDVFCLCLHLALKPLESLLVTTANLPPLVQVKRNLWSSEDMAIKDLILTWRTWTGEPLMDHLFQSGFTMYLGEVKPRWPRLMPRLVCVYDLLWLYVLSTILYMFFSILNALSP